MVNQKSPEEDRNIYGVDLEGCGDAHEVGHRVIESVHGGLRESCSESNSVDCDASSEEEGIDGKKEREIDYFRTVSLMIAAHCAR